MLGTVLERIERPSSMEVQSLAVTARALTVMHRLAVQLYVAQVHSTGVQRVGFLSTREAIETIGITICCTLH